MKSKTKNASVQKVLFSNLLRLTFAGSLCVGAAAMGATISDNFDDGNDTAPTIAWQHLDPISDATSGLYMLGTWSFPGGNTYRLQTAASPDPSTFGPARLGSIALGNFTNFYVAVDVVNWDATVHQFFGILARVGTPGPGTTSGYLFGWDTGDPTTGTSGDMDIVRIDGENPSDLDGNTYFGNDSIHLITDHSYRFVFMGVADTFRGQVFDLTNTVVPLVDYGTTDPLYDPTAADHVSGTTGVLIADNSSTHDGTADATFDNFLATDGSLLSTTFPLLSISKPSPSSVQVTWPGVGNGASQLLTTNLQSSPSLSSPIWTPVTTGITTNGVENVYTVSPATGNQFFKIVLP
jgi:hypothetical protein